MKPWWKLTSNTGVSTCQAPVQKLAKQSNLIFRHTSLTDCFTVWCPLFFWQSAIYVLIAILPQVLKTHFEWKHSKTDYSKYILKEEKRGQTFVWVLVYWH